MVAYHLSLDYNLHPGWMTPFVEGLQAGLAVARRCAACAQTAFPPQRICACGEADGAWITLTGDAIITFRTEGADGAFALVVFAGADTSAVVRLTGLASDQTRGTLHASDTGLTLGPFPKAPR
ncbi:hypothetical protein A8B78_02370 [Jannaschia sp. EhC01]|nr:hypothetical protein A8B78_02370 [Jannaschia sp. EhC01]